MGTPRLKKQAAVTAPTGAAVVAAAPPAGNDPVRGCQSPLRDVCLLRQGQQDSNRVSAGTGQCVIVGEREGSRQGEPPPSLAGSETYHQLLPQRVEGCKAAEVGSF